MILALLLTLSPTIDLAAVGDVMLGRYVGRRIAREGASSVFGSCSRELRGADLALGNLECVLSRRLATANKQIRLVADPSLAPSLARAGFDGFSVANNHALDCGPLGLADTVSALGSARIRAVDGGIQLVTVKGIRIALLAFSDFDEGARTSLPSSLNAQFCYPDQAGMPPGPNPFPPRKGSVNPRRMRGELGERDLNDIAKGSISTFGGVDYPSLPVHPSSLGDSPISLAEEGDLTLSADQVRAFDPSGSKRNFSVGPGNVADEIRKVRTKADVVIVMWHWGNELSLVVSERQKALAQQAAKAGADVILGSHPHVLQPIEWLPAGMGRRCLVAYSLGNFIFDARPGVERKTGILHVALDKAGAKGYRLSRYHIERGAPRPD